MTEQQQIRFYLLAFVTSLSSWDDDVVITPVVGCIEKRVGDAGNCSMMEYLRRVCRVSGSSSSVAQTCPTVVPTYTNILFNFQNFYSSNFPFDSSLSTTKKFCTTNNRNNICTFSGFHIKYHFLSDIPIFQHFETWWPYPYLLHLLYNFINVDNIPPWPLYFLTKEFQLFFKLFLFISLHLNWSYGSVCSENS